MSQPVGTRVLDLPNKVTGIVTRLRRGKDGQDELETLACGDAGFNTLLGASERGGVLSLGAPLLLRDANTGDPWHVPETTRAYGPTYDPWSESVVFCTADDSVYRLTKDNKVELLADEYTGSHWRRSLRHPSLLTSDGAGSIFCVCSRGEDYALRLNMPENWRASAKETAPAVHADGSRVQVSDVPTPWPELRGQTWVPSCRGRPGYLAMASATALYRLQPQPPQGGRGGGDGGDGGARLERMAGDEDEHGTADGQGWEARFCSIQDIFADAEGALYILDKVRGEDGGRACTMRRMAPDGTVTTLASGLKSGYYAPKILPNGSVVLGCSPTPAVMVLALGLKLPSPCCPPSPPGPPPRTLAVDLGALLDGQPEGSWDVTIVVGDRRFPAHRLILSARSDYFGSRLSRGKFADGAAAELSLPDADPDVFELLLRYIYTGAADIPPALAPAVAVLADRLLLPLLCADAQAAVLSAVTAESVAESLLWAERLGDGFSGLLSSLKAWFLEHFEEVHEAAPGSLERLSAESPKLMVELHLGVARSAKRQRTG